MGKKPYVRKVAGEFEKEQVNLRFVDWKGEFRKKEKYLKENFEEIAPKDFIQEVIPKEFLSTWHPKEEHINTGKPCGIIKTYLREDPKREGKAQFRKELLFDNYQAFEKTQNNRFALMGLCTMFGMQGRDGCHLSECHGFAIDLDAVRLKELQNLIGQMENDMVPIPTMIVNSGHGLHLYYLFEQPIEVRDVNTITILTKLKKALVVVLWNEMTSIDPNLQFQGITQDMRVPGSWTKFGRNNKSKCSYILRAFRTGRRVDLTYLSNFLEEKHYLPKDWASISEHKRIPLEEAKKLYPKWYERIVVQGQEKGFYVQNRGLYEWWKKIITQNDVDDTQTSRNGNRYLCIEILFVMAFKCQIPFEEVMLDAVDLIPFMNQKPHPEENEFLLEDVLFASNAYKRKYVRWSNKTISRRAQIKLPKPSIERKGRTQEEHLKRARHMRKLSSYEKVGRPKGSDKSAIVKEWRFNNPCGSKAACIRETGLDKKTVYKWWN